MDGRRRGLELLVGGRLFGGLAIGLRRIAGGRRRRVLVLFDPWLSFHGLVDSILAELKMMVGR